MSVCEGTIVAERCTFSSFSIHIIISYSYMCMCCVRTHRRHRRRRIDRLFLLLAFSFFLCFFNFFSSLHRSRFSSHSLWVAAYDAIYALTRWKRARGFGPYNDMRLYGLRVIFWEVGKYLTQRPRRQITDKIIIFVFAFGWGTMTSSFGRVCDFFYLIIIFSLCTLDRPKKPKVNRTI